MTWNMAALRQRTYKPRREGLHKNTIGPEVVNLVDRAGAVVNGVELPYSQVQKLAFSRDDSCLDCGFVVCGCDRRCDECDSLLHAGFECPTLQDDDEEYECEHCGEYVTDGHDENACESAHTQRLHFVPFVPHEKVLDLELVRKYSFPLSTPFERPGRQSALYGAIYTAYMHDEPPPAEADPRTVIEVLNDWAMRHEASGFVNLTNPKCLARCKSWLISMQIRSEPDSALGLLQLLHRLRKHDEDMQQRCPQPSEHTIANFRKFCASKPDYETPE